jgi:hypothetical protein
MTAAGFARVRFPSGLVIHEIGLHISRDHASAAPPSDRLRVRRGSEHRPVHDNPKNGGSAP